MISFSSNFYKKDYSSAKIVCQNGMNGNEECQLCYKDVILILNVFLSPKNI